MTLMIHYIFVLGGLVICGFIATGTDEGLFRRGLDSIDANRNGDFHSRNDAEVGLAWIYLTK